MSHVVYFSLTANVSNNHEEESVIVLIFCECFSMCPKVVHGGGESNIWKRFPQNLSPSLHHKTGQFFQNDPPSWKDTGDYFAKHVSSVPRTKVCFPKLWGNKPWHT